MASDNEEKAFCVPTSIRKTRASVSPKKKATRKMKKEGCSTGNPVKAGYIIMICPGFSAEKRPVSTVGRRIPFTENVKPAGKITFYVKPGIRYLPETEVGTGNA